MNKDTKTIHFDHVAIGCWSVEDATHLMRSLTAISKVEEEGENWTALQFIAKQWYFRQTGKIEIIQSNPQYPESFMIRFLKAHGAPKPHHVTFKVPSIEDAKTRAESFGFKVVGYNISDPTWKEFFLHPKEAQGIVVQFAESTESMVVTQTPKTLVNGVRLKVKDGNKSELIFGKLLQGKLEKKENLLEFSWPTSSMKIFVDIDPQAEDGVDKILLSTSLDVKLDNGFEKILEISTEEPGSKL